MKNIRMTILLLVCGAMISLAPSCSKEGDVREGCNAITLNTPFTAKIGETWCIPATGWEITFGPFLEDSRCNVHDLECFWEGRFVMDATIDNGEPHVVTFDPHMSAKDTVVSGPYTIIVEKVHPETRDSFEPLEPGTYSFDIVVK